MPAVSENLFSLLVSWASYTDSLSFSLPRTPSPTTGAHVTDVNRHTSCCICRNELSWKSI